MANRAVVFFAPELNPIDFPEFSRSRSNKATFSRNTAFSCLSCWFSRFKSDNVDSNEETYSFFFLRDKQADSRFFIIRCCRFKAFTYIERGQIMNNG